MITEDEQVRWPKNMTKENDKGRWPRKMTKEDGQARWWPKIWPSKMTKEDDQCRWPRKMGKEDDDQTICPMKMVKEDDEDGTNNVSIRWNKKYRLLRIYYLMLSPIAKYDYVFPHLIMLSRYLKLLKYILQWKQIWTKLQRPTVPTLQQPGFESRSRTAFFSNMFSF